MINLFFLVLFTLYVVIRSPRISQTYIGHRTSEIIFSFSVHPEKLSSIFRKAGKITERYEKMGKTVYIRHLDSSSRVLLAKAEKIIHVNFTDDDPAFKIVLEEGRVMG
ncbi:hypothetical protein [Aquiflexum balticum]|uniref:hypothetical protein n=1 Tax=Aquiflexum balticum TaxID=280473 RepID=UPI000A0438BC|nr:hypothetical protein [Aquiflexum balticum]